MRLIVLIVVSFAAFVDTGFAQPTPSVGPDFNRQIAPLLKKYCVGCHNADDREGKLSLESFGDLQRGGKRGAAVLPGNGAASRLVRVLTGAAEPKMPPPDNPAPTKAEVARIADWVNSGARGPDGQEIDRKILVTPKIEPAPRLKHAVTAIDVSPDGKLVAVARFRNVELRSSDLAKVVRTLESHPGKVNGVQFSKNGQWLVTASGIAGLYGVAGIYDVQTGKLIRSVEGHRDTMYAAVLSPNGEMLATGSYDKKILLWNAKTGTLIREIAGHNDAVYDLAFSPDNTLLSSASGDETVKIWQVSTGRRLDTLGQPTAEQYTVTFSPDGRYVLAGGVDNRIRVWRVVSRDSVKINPMIFARFGHEGPIVKLAFSADGKTLVSAAEDRTIKLWETERFTERHLYERQPETTHAVAMAADGQSLVVGRVDGSLQRYPVVSGAAAGTGNTTGVAEHFITDARKSVAITEQEPNNGPKDAMPITIPATITGVIHGDMESTADQDVYRFRCKQGEVWVLDVNAARSKSPLDSKIEVLDAKGSPVLRSLLQATRDSYIKFRGVDSNTRDCRVHNWEEMNLNEYLFIGGEVVKLYLAPRGPDSGFAFYPHGGNRRCYFDTSASSHALHAPCYIVKPHAPGAKLIPNGLPVFPLYFENDDDGWRQLGADSRLTFTAPADGEYLVRIQDVRGFQGDQFKYTLTVRPSKPDFSVALGGANPTIGAGSGQEFSVSANRVDGFEGAIRVDISNLPDGFHATTPLVIEAGHDRAIGTLNALPSAPNPSAEALKNVKVTATATVLGKAVTKSVNNFGTIKLAQKPKLLVTVFPSDGQPSPVASRKWTVVRPIRASAVNGTKLTLQSDDSVLASGKTPETDSYVIALESQARGIRAIKLEVMGHDSLPGKAPGRADPNGNFVLSEIKINAGPIGGKLQPMRVKLRSASADYSQAGWDIGGAIDGNQKTGWAIAEKSKDDKFPVKKNGSDPSHVAIFEFAQPIEFETGTQLTVVLDQMSDVKSHTLGRFRISVTTDSIGEFPQPQELVIRPGETITATVRIERNGFNGRVRFEAIDQNLPHGVIVDNIGLSGLLIVEGTNERTFFLTAAK
ncbi:MAG: hypothetical protein O3A00_13245, partial [Planctomycetota bacterium]|nr:hypothetical protein [Planctomycetota bacterium]